MNENDSKYVVLVDPFRGGHHNGYLKIYESLIRSLGFDVEITPPSLSEDIKPLNLWMYTTDLLKKIISKKKRKPSMVFIMWADSFLDPFLPPLLIDLVFPYKWFGIYFHPRFLRIGRVTDIAGVFNEVNIFKSSNCIGVGVLDKHVVDRLEKILDKKVFPVPGETVTDVKKDGLITRNIKKKAKGRKIVGLVGSLERRKGVITLLQLARSHVSENIFFVFVGELARRTFRTDELKLIQRTLKEKPPNIYCQFKRVEDDESFNSIIRALDVLYLSYIDFPHSSGLLTKAAFFRKPVIVSKGYYMEEVVKKFNLGLVVNQESTEESYVAAKRILRKKIFPDSGFAKYYQENSSQSLVRTLKKILCVE